MRFQFSRRLPAALSAVALALSLGGGLAAAPAHATAQAGGSTVSEVPVNGTPHVLDGRVLSIIQVGSTMVLGGTFTKARNNDSDVELSRTGVLAFDVDTKQISTTFVPQTDGYVNVVLPAPDGTSVFVGGMFDTIGGVARKNLARVRLSDGAVLTTFDGQVAGEVRDLRLINNRLWVAGAFTQIAGRNQTALAALWPASGAFNGYMKVKVAGTHNGGNTTVAKIDVNSQGDRLGLIGNFTTIGGVANRQAGVLDLSAADAAAVSTWGTQFYTTTCSSSFDSYVRDIDFAPSGTFFVISTTGAYRSESTACDTTARFETYAVGPNVAPTWINTTGGDTTYAVEITDSVVYTGGHARWQNNPYAADAAGRGAVSRTGIAALDPVNGLPLSWNPTRDRGVGVFDLLVTSDGLWVGSDTDRIGADYLRSRIALLPAAGGQSWSSISTPELPGDVYLAQPLGNEPAPTPTYRVNAGGSSISATPVNWSSDTTGQPSPYHQSGLTRNTYSTAVGSVDATVPAGTPATIFQTELVGNSSQSTQAWNIPVTSGTEVEVRMYFANRSTSTQSVGQRVFNVDLEGDRVLNNYDIVAAVGTNRGTMRNFTVISDGNLDLDLSRVTNYPLINAIEIVRKDQATPAASSVKRSFDGTAAGADQAAPSGGPAWGDIRGAFMLNGELYTGLKDGSFSKRSFNGSAFGTAEAVNTQDQLTPLSDWRADIKSATSMFYDNGRVYFTVNGQNTLYFRYFTPSSKVIGARRYVAAADVSGVDFGKFRGAFLSGDKLYFADTTGKLFRADWANAPYAGAPVGGTSTQVSGPGIDAASWNARALFVYQGPIARFTFACTDVTCSYDASTSTASGSPLTTYAWDFGDGSTGSGVTTEHTFSSPGTRTVHLTVTAANGQTASVSHEVATTQSNRAPVASFTSSCDHLDCTFDGSASSDADGDALTYAWDFGDGTTAEGVNATHTYATAGNATVTLTVSDGTSTGTATHVVSPWQGDLAYVGAATTAGNRSTHSVVVPADVQPGDALVVLLTSNSDATISDLSDWTLLQSRNGSGIRGRAWTRTAVAGDAGSTVSVTTSALAKSVMSVSAYRGSLGTATVSASAVGGTDGSSTSLTTPTVAVGSGGSWLLSYWSEKSADAQTWTLPGGATSRTTGSATGSGKVSSVLADSAAVVPTGQAGGLTATTSTSTTRSALFSLVLSLS